MKQITLRGIPGEVSKAAEREARQRGVSLNKAYISLLEKVVGSRASGKVALVHHDLDRFCGIWSAREAATFDRALSGQRVVDEELWK